MWLGVYTYLPMPCGPKRADASQSENEMMPFC